MAFDQTTRNRLARFVGDCRELLSEEFTRQLQSIYGIDPKTGDIADLDGLTLSSTQFETARLLRETLDHYLASMDTGTAAKAKKARLDALNRIVREQAFTVLNRLCAIRMAEARGLCIECIGKGYQSQGFQLYKTLAGTALGETGDAYRCFLFSLFDEFALDLPVLFDRFSPEGRLFPREAALLEVLGHINHADIDPLWAEDETIGWIYQYFNSKDERKAMRDASQAPRNSRELAVRNQFFTPRYVVEFLTDNTLGRIWYEMTQGQTGLKDSCRYLVRRPNEIFLAEGEQAPEQDKPAEDLSQEELLKQPVYIPFRPLKDPRDIKMLDPACGSMHFGLYAFDLFERIYAEAWDLEAERGVDAFVRPEGLTPLRETYDSKEAFLRDVPRLIIERNIHGIDIDPRAVQIAGLSLWLRAQKSWAAQGLQAADRPQIQRSNIVCAEPMPGEANMLEEFLRGLRDDRLESLILRVLHVPENQQVRATARMVEALCDLVRTVWKEMELAGEAGSLLKIEESLADAIAKGKEEWVEKAPLFRVMEFGLTEETQANPKVKYYKNVPGEEEDFWNRAELLVLSALDDFASQAGQTDSAGRTMFARDAARGFAFIDLLRNRFDVALMNPPFGDSSRDAKKYIDGKFKTAKTDLGMAFVTRWLSRLHSDGCLGAITNRVFLANQKLAKWRNETLLDDGAHLQVLADLGMGVLDALVEAACYVVLPRKSRSSRGSFFRLLDSRQKGDSLRALLASEHPSDGRLYRVSLDALKQVPSSIMCYWLPPAALRLLSSGSGLSDVDMEAKQGMASGDDFRFFRLWWEVAASSIATDGDRQSNAWVPLVKGGEYSPLIDSPHLLVDWRKRGAGLKAYVVGRYPYLNGDWGWVVKNSDSYFARGLTYPARTASDFSPRIMPRGCIFSAKGQSLIGGTDQECLLYLVGAYTRFYKAIVEAFLGSGDSSVSGSAAKDIRSGLLNDLPHPLPSTHASSELLDSACRAVWAMREMEQREELSRHFSGPWNTADLRSINGEARARTESRCEAASLICELNIQVEEAQAAAFGLSPEEWEQICQITGEHPLEYEEAELSTADVSRLLELSDSGIVAECVERRGASRQVTKKAYIADRRLELAAHASQISLRSWAASDQVRSILSKQSCREVAKAAVSFAVGSAFGRWQSEAAITQMDASLEALFAPLPVRAPAEASDQRCPVILVSELGADSSLTSAVRAALSLDSADRHTLEHEICTEVKCDSIAEYLAHPSKFFADHLSLYSQSRRSAPVYWPLSVPSCKITLWIYYHNLTDQTLYTCVNDVVDPRMRQLSDQIAVLRSDLNRSAKKEQELEQLCDLETELMDFRDELLRIAKFWKPDLNDGVQITAAPLWKLFQHRQWQARLKETWEKLEAGEYDWAHLALSIWPDRVVRASHKDRSYAIAHDLEDHLWHEVEVENKTRGGKVKKAKEWQPRKLTEAQLDAIVAEVKAR